MTDASLEYIQLLTQSEILQCHLFITRKYQQDRPNNNQDSVQHSAASLSGSLIKINCLRDRRDFGEAQAARALRSAVTDSLLKLSTPIAKWSTLPGGFPGRRTRKSFPNMSWLFPSRLFTLQPKKRW